jgi:hypothetical protein
MSDEKSLPCVSGNHLACYVLCICPCHIGPAAAVPEAQDGREAWDQVLDSHLVDADPESVQDYRAGWEDCAKAVRAHLASAAVREGERERLAEAWERGVAAEREFASRVQAYHHWSNISAGPPEPPTNPYLAAPSLAAPEGTGEKP